MELKNKSFTFLGTRYTVKYVDQIKDEDGNIIFGQFHPDKKEILLAVKDLSGKPYTENNIKHTFMHELFHLIFFEGQYSSCYSDEPLVEWCAKAVELLQKGKVI